LRALKLLSLSIREAARNRSAVRIARIPRAPPNFL
jgi:hypothetical protein